jgi:hypothetical protein
LELPLAGFQVITYGRFWVITEAEPGGRTWKCVVVLQVQGVPKNWMAAVSTS